ncbi:MAG TPA: hypothetical protein VFT12_11480 [Thermoanaerobaculia bacterium]|nr:hypothetical protein [Thermoanaerobaculia bacterium]
MRATKLFVICCFLSAALFGDERIRRWQTDLRYLQEEMEARHAKVDHTISRTELRSEIVALEQRLPALRDDQIVVEIARITAKIGDGHTGVFFFSNRGNFPHRRIPIELYAASDGWLILAASNEYASLAGQRILEIGSTDIEEISRAIQPLMPRDNEESLRARSVKWIVLAELLQTLGFVEDADDVPLLVEDSAGERRSVVVHPVPRGTSIEWVHASAALWLRNRDRKYWMEYLEDSKMLYVQFNSADISAGAPEEEWRAFTHSIVDTVETRKPDKLVIDLRWNAGGSFLRTRHLLWAVIRADSINRKGKLFTILSPISFSAAMSLATELDFHTQTLFVGEVGGGRPNAYGDLGRLMLPNSGIEVRFSRYYYGQSVPEDTRPTIFPDLVAPLSIAGYRAGVDPALEVIRNYKPPVPIGNVIGPVALENGVEAAVQLYRRLRKEKYNDYSWEPNELDRIGTRLMDAGRTADALKIYRLNSAEHPWWAWGHARLGYTLIESGDRNAGLEEYRRAFELDKRNGFYRDELRKSP